MIVILLSGVIIKLVQYMKPVILATSEEMLTLTSTGLAFAMMWVSNSYSNHTLTYCIDQVNTCSDDVVKVC